MIFGKFREKELRMAVQPIILERNILQKQVEELHVAVCQAVTLMNVGNNLEAHNILRQSLIEFANTQDVYLKAKEREIE